MKHYSVFQCDNGDDYVSEGLYRIVDKRGRIGYADAVSYTHLFSLGFLMIAEAYLLPSTLMRIDGHKAEPVENIRTEVPQR